jgi:hypothetical protein
LKGLYFQKRAPSERIGKLQAKGQGGEQILNYAVNIAPNPLADIGNSCFHYDGDNPTTAGDERFARKAPLELAILGQCNPYMQALRSDIGREISILKNPSIAASLQARRTKPRTAGATDTPRGANPDAVRTTSSRDTPPIDPIRTAPDARREAPDARETDRTRAATARRATDAIRAPNPRGRTIAAAEPDDTVLKGVMNGVLDEIRKKKGRLSKENDRINSRLEGMHLGKGIDLVTITDDSMTQKNIDAKAKKTKKQIRNKTAPDGTTGIPKVIAKRYTDKDKVLKLKTTKKTDKTINIKFSIPNPEGDSFLSVSPLELVRYLVATEKSLEKANNAINKIVSDAYDGLDDQQATIKTILKVKKSGVEGHGEAVERLQKQVKKAGGFLCLCEPEE